LGILLEAEIESISEVQRVKNYGKESEWAKGKSWGLIMEASIPPRNSKLSRKRHWTPAKYSKATRTEWSSRAHE